MGEDEGVASADLEEAQGQAPALLVLCEPSQDGMLLEEMDRLVKGERPERQNDGAAGAGDACEPVAAGGGGAGAGLRGGGRAWGAGGGWWGGGGSGSPAGGPREGRAAGPTPGPRPGSRPLLGPPRDRSRSCRAPTELPHPVAPQAGSAAFARSAPHRSRDSVPPSGRGQPGAFRISRGR